SMAYFVANESVPLEPSFAAPAWACTGCFGCRSECDHRNDVTGTLFDARSALVGAGEGPASARSVLDRFAERAAVLRETARAADVAAFVGPAAPVAGLVGCEHARRPTEAAFDLVRAVATLERSKVAIVEECCGAPLLYAGDGARFAAQGAAFARAVEG